MPVRVGTKTAARSASAPTVNSEASRPDIASEQTRSPREYVAGLGDPLVESLLAPSFNDIDTVASFLGIDEGYLSVQVRLLIPQFPRNRLEGQDGRPIVRSILSTLRGELEGFESYYKAHRSRNRIDSLPPELKLKKVGPCLQLVGAAGTYEVVFDEVNAADGIQIQNEIHYIHSARADTAFHLGLRLAGADFPLCYCAVSPCDREYQRRALEQFLGKSVEMHEVAVMTRAYGYGPLPKNMMSKLFDLTAQHLARTSDFRYIITALNPFLGFRGSIFFGASFLPFALSPLTYRYTQAGLYANRRNADDVVSQNYETPPIVWLYRPIGRVPDKPWSGTIVDISAEMYANG